MFAMIVISHLHIWKLSLEEELVLQEVIQMHAPIDNTSHYLFLRILWAGEVLDRLKRPIKVEVIIAYKILDSV